MAKNEKNEKKQETEELEKSTVKEEAVREKVMFTKDQILASKRYNEKKDLLAVALETEKSYSLADLEIVIEKFMKGKVN